MPTGKVYIILCVLVPAAWGLLASWIFDRLAARRQDRHPGSSQTTPNDEPIYYI